MIIEDQCGQAANSDGAPVQAANLMGKIESREALVAVIGLGYAGLPVAIAFGEAGFRVVGIDIDRSRVDAITCGQSYLNDVPRESVRRLTSMDHDRPKSERSASGARAVKRLRATTSYDALADADVAIICVPTPLSKTKDPDLSSVVAVTDEIGRHMHRGMLVVLESTTYPGTTQELVLPRLEQGKGSQFEVGRDFFLAFSPERIDPGRTDWTISNTPKVIGGLTSRCTEIVRALYGCVVHQVVPVSSPKAAEMVKLLENTFRATNVALVNEFALMCDRLDVDVWEVIAAAETKPFGFMPFYPGPGLGGHCVPIDPQYLAWKLKTLNYTARFIQLAADINFGMPAVVLGKISDALNDCGKPLKGSRVLVLGVAYKADVGDLRESPATDLILLLQGRGAEVSYHDPHVPSIALDSLTMTSVPLDSEVVRSADCAVIVTAHSSFDWQWVVDNSQLVLDTRNATHGTVAGTCRVVKL